MTRDEALAGLLGGALIGAAAGTLLLFNGDVLGASGIMSSVSLNPAKALSESSQHWKFVFISCFLITSNLAFSTFEPEAPTLSALGYGLAGFLVGFGTKLGNGCTSGHGICGLPRMSRRSLVAVLTFMGSGAATAVLTKGAFPADAAEASAEPMGFWAMTLGWVALGAAVAARWFHRRDAPNKIEHRAKLIPAAISGALFAKGLQISGMAKASNVYGFLDVTKISAGTWNPRLAMVMGGGVVVSFMAYQMVPEISLTRSKSSLLLTCPVTQPKDKGFTGIPRSQVIDFNLVAGAVLFGMGWGLGGMCPGPALFLAGVGAPAVLTQWMPGFWVGSYLADLYKTGKNKKN